MAQSRQYIPYGPDVAEQAPDQSTQTETSVPKVARGGGVHKVTKGETLGSISQSVYGSRAFWNSIAAANPEKVHRGGQIIYVGEELAIPILQVPSAGAPKTFAPETPAVQPREEWTEYGNFLVVPEDFEGELPAWESGPTYRESEFSAELAKRKQAAKADLSRVVESVDDLLSYSWNDWVVTDEEALKALNFLAGLPFPERKAAIRQLGWGKVDRLMDNLPSSGYASAEFPSVVMAMGPESVQARLGNMVLRAYFGLVSETELQQVSAVLSWMPEKEQQKVFDDVGTAGVTRLVEVMPSGSNLTDDQKWLLRSIFFWAPDSAVDLMKLTLSKRFDVSVDQGEPVTFDDGTGSKGVAWEEGGLRRSWEVLEMLPEAHVENNLEFDEFERFVELDEQGAEEPAVSTGGYYQGGDMDTVALSYNEQNLDAENYAADQNDPLYGVNRFDKVVRHEVGHAVDDRGGFSKSYCKKAAGGGWVKHGDLADIAHAWLDHLGGVLDNMEMSDPGSVSQPMVDAMHSGKPDEFLAAMVALPMWDDLDMDVGIIIEADSAMQALRQSLDKPWYDHNGGAVAAGRIYQRSYVDEWTSYDAVARLRKISVYQFRAPEEWFAEVYATYFEPNQSEHGALLAARDPATCNWFRANVL